MSALAHRPLGASGLEVSVFALGSWRTYERIPREAGVAVLQGARASGIDFLEVARYNDESGTAPIPTGYSEVVFGEVFAASGWPRDDVTIASKLWWEFWPQTPAQELAASLERTGLERFDFVYSDPPPPDLPMTDVVGSVAELVSDGRVRAWGIVNWPAERVAEAGRVAHELGVAPPCAAQLPYSLVARDWVESSEMTEALLACGAKVVASYVLAGGILSGKYAAGEGGRMSGEVDAPRWEDAVRAWGIVNWPAQRVAEAGRVARELGVAPPCAAQLPYSLIARDWVEGPEMTAALRSCGAKVVASYVLAGGILTGKYAAPGATGRMVGEPRSEAAVRAVEELGALAAELGTTPADLAMAFVLANPGVATILFGATRPEQIRENVAAAEVAEALTEGQLARLRAIGA